MVRVRDTHVVPCCLASVGTIEVCSHMFGTSWEYPSGIDMLKPDLWASDDGDGDGDFDDDDDDDDHKNEDDDEDEDR